MIWLIAKKDFLLNLSSVRFVIGFVLCLIIIPFTMVVSIDDYQNQMRIYKIDQAEAEEELKDVYVYSKVRPTVVKEPEILSIFSKGINNNVGNRVKINFGEYPLFPSGHTSSRDNPLLNAFFSIDFSTVIAIVISLLALVFAYDSISREREDGTMKLVFTGQVSRISFLMGKLLGLLITLLPILVFCYLLACLIILLSPGVSFSASDWSGISLLFLTSIVYMFVFVLLGMFISSLASHSSSAIVVSLLCWIGFLFLIPNISTYLSQSIVPTPLYENVRTTMDEYNKEYWKQRGEQWQKVYEELGMTNIFWWNHNGGGEDDDGYEEITGGVWEMTQHHKKMNEWSEPVRLANADKMWAIQKDYLDRLGKQQHVQQYLSWLSPSELFGQATDVLCRTDANAFLKYMDTQRDYRQTVIRFFLDKNIFSSYRYFTAQPEEEFPTQQEWNETRAWEGKYWYSGLYPKLNTDDVPRYVQQKSSPMNTFKAALGRFTALLFIAVILLLATIIRFMKYDVR